MFIYGFLFVQWSGNCVYILFLAEEQTGSSILAIVLSDLYVGGVVFITFPHINSLHNCTIFVQVPCKGAILSSSTILSVAWRFSYYLISTRVDL